MRNLRNLYLLIEIRTRDFMKGIPIDRTNTSKKKPIIAPCAHPKALAEYIEQNIVE